MIILEISHFLLKDIISFSDLETLDIYFRHIREVRTLDSLFFQILRNRRISCYPIKLILSPLQLFSHVH